MPEYDVTISSPPGTADSAEQLEHFAQSLVTDGRLLRPQPLLTEDGRLCFTAAVTADNMDEASFAACLPYWAAITAAGLTLNDDSQVEITQADEHGTYSARVRVERKG